MKTGEIRHKRLHAFYESKVLNGLCVVTVVSLFAMFYTEMMLAACVCAAMAFLCFIGYTIWFWVRKPKEIVVNKLLSDVSGLFVLYFLIVGAIKSPSQWWYIFPIVAGVALLCITLMTDHDKKIII